MSGTKSQKPENKRNLQIDADDDLDDLDDVLSQFTPSNAPKGAPPLSPLTSPPPPPPTATTKTTFNRPRTNTRVDQPPVSTPGTRKPLSSTEEAREVNEAELSDEFTKALMENMQDLMRELTEEGIAKDVIEKNDGEGKTDEKQKETEKMMKAAWEAMLIEGMDGMAGDGSGAPSSSAESGKPSDFQSKIKQTMEKLKESESNLQSSSSGNPESLEGLLASLKDLGLDDLGGEGGEDDAELAGFLENMMGHLMGKEVLYEPLKELHDKFPAYLANPPPDLEAADKARFEAQYSYVQKIVAIFDDPGYKEDDATGKKVADLMGEMQSHGAPPESIMGPMPPEFGPDGNCVVS